MQNYTFTVERRPIPKREVKNYERYIKESEAINGRGLVLPKTTTTVKESNRRAKGVSSIYSW